MQYPFNQIEKADSITSSDFKPKELLSQIVSELSFVNTKQGYDPLVIFSTDSELFRYVILTNSGNSFAIAPPEPATMIYSITIFGFLR